MKNGLNIENASKKRIVTVAAISLSVVSFILLSVVFYMFSNSKTIYLQSLKHMANNLKEIISESNNSYFQDIIKEDKIKVTSDIGISISNQELFNINLSYLENKKSEKATFDLSLVENNNTLLELNGALANSNIYIKVKDIMDYYYTTLPFTSLYEEINSDDYQKIIDIFVAVLEKNINEDNIKKTKDKVTLNKKEKKVTKLSYEVTEEMISNILVDTIDNILKDDKLVKSLSDVLGVTEKKFIEGFANYKTELKFSKDKSIYYNIYYYGFNNIVMFELESDDFGIKFYDYDNIYEFVVSEKDKDLFTLKLEENKDKYEISGKIDSYTYTGTLIEADNSISLDLSFVVQGMILDFNFEESINEKSNEIDSKMTLGVLGQSIVIDINTKYEMGKEVDITGLENAKDFSLMTEDDLQSIITNIKNHPLLSSIYQAVFSYSSMSGSSINYDSNYEF